MFSAAFLNLPQLIKWADDPWSFWYPTDFGPTAFPFIFAKGPGGGGVVTGAMFDPSPSVTQAFRVINY